MTKICICFYGLVQRSLKYTLQSIETNIFEILNKHNIEYDIYLHTYDATISHSTRSGEYNIEVDVNDYKLLNPKKYIIESYSDFNEHFDFKNFTEQYNDPWNNNYESMINWIREMNSHLRVTALWEHDKKDYDLCLYLRADLTYITPLPITYIMEHLDSRRNTLFTVPWGKSDGLNDFIGIGDCNTMILWANRLYTLHEYMQKIGNNSEQLVSFICEKHNIHNIDLPMLFYRTRANGNNNRESWQLPEFEELKKQCIRDGGEKKITKHICFFYREDRIEYINSIIKEVNSYNHFVDIYIHTNITLSKTLLVENKKGKIEIVVHDLTDKDPYVLPWLCRDLLKCQKDDYDYFMYVEDDILVKKNTINYYMEYNEELIASNNNLGFIRVEYDQNQNEYVTDIYKPLSNLTTINNSQYLINDYAYCAFWIYNKTEFQKFVDNEWLFNFNVRYPNHKVDYSLAYRPYRADAAWGMHEKAHNIYKNTLIPIVNNYIHPHCRVHHLPNNYINHGMFCSIMFENVFIPQCGDLFIWNRYSSSTILYGTYKNNINITHLALQKCMENDVLHIPRDDYGRACHFSDPLPGTIKSIFCFYSDDTEINIRLNCPFEIKYGIQTHNIDIKQLVLEKCMNNDVLHIPREDHYRASLFSDPAPGYLKHIVIVLLT